MIILSKIEIR